MRILIGKYLLFDHAEPGWALSNFRNPVTRQIQEIDKIRADEIATQFRGLKRTELSFTVSRQWADEEEATSELVLHEREIPTSGLIQVEAPRRAGGTTVLYLTGHLASCTGSHIGRRTFHDYTLIGGAFRTTPKIL